jgi:hypothetical protein
MLRCVEKPYQSLNVCLAKLANVVKNDKKLIKPIFYRYLLIRAY